MTPFHTFCFGTPLHDPAQTGYGINSALLMSICLIYTLTRIVIDGIRREAEYTGRRQLMMDPLGKRARGRPKRRLMGDMKEKTREARIRKEDEVDR